MAHDIGKAHSLIHARASCNLRKRQHGEHEWSTAYPGATRQDISTPKEHKTFPRRAVPHRHLLPPTGPQRAGRPLQRNDFCQTPKNRRPSKRVRFDQVSDEVGEGVQWVDGGLRWARGRPQTHLKEAEWLRLDVRLSGNAEAERRKGDLVLELEAFWTESWVGAWKQKMYQRGCKSYEQKLRSTSCFASEAATRKTWRWNVLRFKAKAEWLGAWVESYLHRSGWRGKKIGKERA